MLWTHSDDILCELLKRGIQLFEQDMRENAVYQPNPNIHDAMKVICQSERGKGAAWKLLIRLARQFILLNLISGGSKRCQEEARQNHQLSNDFDDLVKFMHDMFEAMAMGRQFDGVPDAKTFVDFIFVHLISYIVRTT